MSFSESDITYSIKNKEDSDENQLLIELDLIAKGLFPYNDDKLSEYPSHLHRFCGRGIGIWQYPIQFSKYVTHILQYKITSYLEIGVAAGGTFTFLTEYLENKGDLKLSHAIDIAPPGETFRGGPNIYTEKFKKWLSEKKIAQFIQLNSKEEDLILDNYDLIMIDGDHSYDGVKKDFEKWKNHSKIFVFHDIVNMKTPGVGKFWSELKKEFSKDAEVYEFTDQYDDVYGTYMGIGLLELK